MDRFRRGSDEARSASTTVFEAAFLPDPEKEQLCRTLLAEFGAASVRVNHSSGEMVHSCCLPGHPGEDRHPSASLNYRKLVYRCWSCGNSGGLLWFIASCRGDDTIEGASRWLADQTGQGPEEQSLSSLLQFFEGIYSNGTVDRPRPIPRLNPRIIEPWLAIHPYVVEDRKVPVETAMHFKVGYDPAAKIRTGEDEDGKPQYTVSERIIIPQFWDGDLVGWQSRRLYSDGTPKYHNSLDFPKDTTIYNYDPRRPALVVESNFSVLRQWHSCPIIESTMSATVTDTQLRLLARHPKVILFFDNDEPGWKATERCGDRLSAYTDVWAVENPWAADPGDMDDETFGRLVAEAVPYPIWSPPDPAFIREWKGQAA